MTLERRKLLQTTALFAVSGVAGCGVPEDEVEPKVRIGLLGVEEVRAGWNVRAEVRNVYAGDNTLTGIEFLAFDADGTQLLSQTVDDLPENGPPEREVTFTTASFPSIMTVRMDATPCDDATIPIVYWIGPKTDREAAMDSRQSTWESTDRKCDEPIPPQRVIDRVSAENAG